MAKIGYARVSTSDQSMDLQIDSLKSSGCDRTLDSLPNSTSNYFTVKAGFTLFTASKALTSPFP